VLVHITVVFGAAFARKVRPMLRKMTYGPARLWRRMTRSANDPKSSNVASAHTSYARREGLGTYLQTEERALEIGPGLKPMLRGDNVEYFDVEDRGVGHREGPDAVPEVDHLSETADLSIVPPGVGLVFSSHVIEHTPDLIAHFLDVERLLLPGGRYVMVIPDKRFCFDAAHPPSHLGKIIGAHLEGRTVHSFASLFEHDVLRTHNRAGRHWRGRSFGPGYLEDRLTLAKASLERFRESNGSYLNSHAWQFTPSSFDYAMRDLRALDFINLDLEFVCETPAGRNEFTACLTKSKS